MVGGSVSCMLHAMQGERAGRIKGKTRQRDGDWKVRLVAPVMRFKV